MSGLEIVEIYKRFDQTQALDGVSLQVAEGEIVAILGPSGSGKSTLLYAIAGLISLDAGEIAWSGRSLLAVPPHRRGFGLMFQDFALFPHMNVFENVAFGLRMAKTPPGQIETRVAEMLELVGLAGFQKRDVNTLSGGEQQRVALARSLAPHPRLLMLDEPLGSLDRNLRERLVLDLRQILRKMKQTAIYVTHDQEEAFTLANRVVVMRAGKVEQAGSPQEIYKHPNSPFVARFIGLTNWLPGTVSVQDGRAVVETPVGVFPSSRQKPGPVSVLLRPDTMLLDAGEGGWTIEARVLERTFRGNTTRVVVKVKDSELTFDFLPSVEIPAEGKTIQLSFDPEEAVQVYPGGDS